MNRCAKLFLPICIVFITLSSKTAFADTSPVFKITLSPIYQNIVLKAGSSYSGTTEVVNQGLTPLIYTIIVTPYGVSNENYNPVFMPLSGKPNITNWFTVPTKRGLLLPGKSESISYSINVPANTPAGGYYAAIFAQSNANSLQKSGSQIQASYRVGELFYIDVAGKVVNSGKIASWSASFLQSNQLKATLRIEDSGALHFLSSDHIEFKSIWGSDNYNANLTRFVLPQTIRKVDVSWAKPPAFGLYRISGTATTIGTQKLSNHYVLVVSTSIRIKAAIALGLVILIILLDASFSSIIKSISAWWIRIRK